MQLHIQPKMYGEKLSWPESFAALYAYACGHSAGKDLPMVDST